MDIIANYFRKDADLGPWCNCLKNGSDSNRTDLLQCTCGEERKVYHWIWEDNLLMNVVLSNHNRDVLFHPIYSSGTAAVRGKIPLRQNNHHYWEIKILTHLYGTDVMIGIGTLKMEIPHWKLRFSSMLGSNCESWGYSYLGKVHHNQLTRSYGPGFTIGSLIGVYLDLWLGKLQYYLNRQPLGIAFTGLKDYELYPMVCSTAAHSAMRITCTVSESPTLQIECLKVIGKNQALIKQLWSIPGIVEMIKNKYFWLVPPPPVEEPPKLDLEDECVLPLDAINDTYNPKRLCTAFLLEPC